MKYLWFKLNIKKIIKSHVNGKRTAINDKRPRKRFCLTFYNYGNIKIQLSLEFTLIFFAQTDSDQNRNLSQLKIN